MFWQALNISEETHRTLYAKTKEREVSVIWIFCKFQVRDHQELCKEDSCHVSMFKFTVKVIILYNT